MPEYPDGKLTDFTGAPIIGHSLEMPVKYPYAFHCYLGIAQPIECALAGMKIISYRPSGDEDDTDFFFCLYDRWGHIVKQWPDNYIPDVEEIRQVVKAEAFKNEGRRL